MVLKGLLILFVLTKSLSGRWTEAGMRCSSDGKEECVLLGNCQVWSDLLANRGIQDMETRRWHNENLCGFRGREQSDPRVCCPKDKIKSPQGVDLREKPAPITTLLDVCGRVFEETTRIAGGKDAPGPGAWPWVARLLYRENERSPEKTWCGGALVTRRHLVTAAHCITDKRMGEPVAVVLGEVDITTQYDCLVTADQCGANGTLGEACYNDVECAEPAVKILVKKMTVAPNFEEKGERPWLWTVNDIALIELEEDVSFTNFIRPVCLPHELAPKPFEYRMVLKGWGNEIPGLNRPSSSTVLQELSDLVETPLEDTGDDTGCRTLLRLPLLESQMCVETSKNTANACEGDSGGPVSLLLREDEFDEGYWELTGVISFGNGRCGSRSPLVLTRVGHPETLAWIKKTIGQENLPQYPVRK